MYEAVTLGILDQRLSAYYGLVYLLRGLAECLSLYRGHTGTCELGKQTDFTHALFILKT